MPWKGYVNTLFIWPEVGYLLTLPVVSDVVREALWILIASFLAVFDICDAVGEDGNPIDVDKIANLRSVFTRFLLPYHGDWFKFHWHTVLPHSSIVYSSLARQRQRC